MLIALYECSLWTVLFCSRRENHTTYTCMHSQALPAWLSLPGCGRQAPGLSVWLEPVLFLLRWPTALSGKLVEGLEEMRGGEDGRELSSPSSPITSTGMSIKPNLLFQNIFVCRIQNTESTGKKCKPWRALLALSGLSQSMALHSWSKSFKCLLPVESEHVLSKRWLVPDRPSSPSSPSTKTLAPRFILQPQRPLVKSEAVCVQCFSGCSTFWGARGSKMQEGGVLCGSSRGRRHTHSTLDPPRPV